MKHNQSKWKFNFKFSRTKYKFNILILNWCRRVIRELYAWIFRFITLFMFWWQFFPSNLWTIPKGFCIFWHIYSTFQFSIRTHIFSSEKCSKEENGKPHVKKIRICYLFALRQAIFHLNENINKYILLMLLNNFFHIKAKNAANNFCLMLKHKTTGE